MPFDERGRRARQSIVAIGKADDGKVTAEPEEADEIGKIGDLGMHHQRSGHLHPREVDAIPHIVDAIGHALIGLDLLDLPQIFRNMLGGGRVVGA